MIEAPKITINTDGITEEQKATEKFKSAYRDMLGQLSAPGVIPVLCAHEAAHLIYFHHIGTKQYEPHPAQLKYDPKIDDYVGHLANVEILDLPPFTPGKFDEWLFDVGRAYAAGGVVARKLMPTSDGGDQNDKERFKSLCEEINSKNPNVKIDWDQCWKAAQKAVETDLENPKLMEQIQEQALIVRRELGL